MNLQNEKITWKRFSNLQKKVERKDSEGNILTFHLQTVRFELNKTWKKSIQIGTVGTLQNWNWEVNSWHVQLLCNVGWSWHGHWRWQGYHVQAQMWSPMLTNKSIENEALSKTWVLTGKEFEDLGRWREQKHCSRPFKKTQSNTRTLKESTEHGTCSQ